MKNFKVLIKRDLVENYVSNNYVPKDKELVVAYEVNNRDLIYKIGDGKTSWVELPELTKISELDRFNFYAPEYEYSIVEVILNPFLSIKEEVVINEDDPNAITL